MKLRDLMRSAGLSARGLFPEQVDADAVAEKPCSLLHDDMMFRDFSQPTNSTFTGVSASLGVPHPGLMSGSGDGIDCRMPFTCSMSNIP